jgi:hypothetical protein
MMPGRDSVLDLVIGSNGRIWRLRWTVKVTLGSPSVPGALVLD